MISHLPVINAQGVGFKLPNEPLFIEDLSDFIGAEKVSVDIIAPIVGATYSAATKAVDGILK